MYNFAILSQNTPTSINILVDRCWIIASFGELESAIPHMINLGAGEDGYACGPVRKFGKNGCRGELNLPGNGPIADVAS
jgi:hypothetical protein